jgi:hypothetical protein
MNAAGKLKAALCAVLRAFRRTWRDLGLVPESLF